MRRDSGFSIVEVLIALLMAVAAMAVVFSLVNQSTAIFAAQTEASDSQQRLRVTAGVLSHELALAGGGPLRGARAGPLIGFMPPVLPYRLDGNGDPPGTFRADAVTIVYVPTDGAEGVTVSPLPALSRAVVIDTAGACPPTGLLCGFSPGMTVLVRDDAGTFDFFTVGGVSGPSLLLQHETADSAYVYQPGSTIIEVVSRTYFLDTNAAAGVDRLMRADAGGGSAVPISDHITGLTFEYFGDPEPPVVHGAAINSTAAWTTYGPKPPLASIPAMAYPPGENCLFVNDGSPTPAPRLRSLGAGHTLVPLTAAQLGDGPWCPDTSHPARFDADLLRIRRIAVSIRVQSAIAAVRGPTSLLFAHGGTARAALQLVPDLEGRFQITPRNASLGN